MSKIVLVFILKWILFLGSNGDPISKNVSNAEFMKRLFEGYSINIPPVLNSDEPVIVDIALYHLSIDNIDMKREIVSARIIFGLKWTDENLRWNAFSFKNITNFALQPSNLWLPDLFIGNSQELFTFIKAENVQEVTLTDIGVVEAWLYLHIEVGIDLDIYNYPFDVQICDFEFGSWMHSNRKIDISIRQSTEELTPSQISRQGGEWDIVNLERNLLIRTFDNYLTNFTFIQFRFSLKRKWQYTIMNLVTPVVITSLLNPLSFLLPVESGERISLSNTVFLTLAVFFSIVNHSLPKTSEGVPVIVAYIGLQMLGSALTIMFTIFSVGLYHRNKNIDQSIFKVLLCNSRKRRQEFNDENDSTNTLDESKIYQSNHWIESWRKASNVLDTTCFLLSFTWNVVLLALVLMKVSLD